MNRTKVTDLVRKYNMKPHEENGSYAECHYPHTGEGRAASGSSYFHVPAGKYTLFHRIDCDEYWCFNAGSDLEVWIIDTEGKLQTEKLGMSDDADLVLFFPKGVIFAARNRVPEGDGSLFTCITVPRFSYSGFELVEKEELLSLCPEADDFFSI